MCSPMQIEVEKPVAKVEVKPEIKRENSAQQAVGRNPVVQIPARRSISNPPIPSPIIKPATPVVVPAAPQIRAPTPLQSTPLPDPRSIDQQVDSLSNKFMSRQGEVVWYYRPKTGAWGLGVVIRRWLDKNVVGGKAYYVQPLSHPHDALPPELVTTENEMKPWLAWSAPTYTYAYLQQNAHLTYEQVDWQSLMSERYGPGVAGVDASIMAAKAIDTTYTLFECLKKVPNGAVQDAHYNGLFLGAEKIWRGDPVRLRIGRDTDVMVITDIVERTSQHAGGQAASAILVAGDIYSYATVPVTNPAQIPEPPQHNTNIPVRMREDMAWRNRLLVPHARTFAYWKLASPGARFDISEIKGRWYETALVFEEPFTKSVTNNEGGNGVWMNSRGDATGVGRVTGVPRPQRLPAFGRAISKETHLTDGIDPPEQQTQDVDMGISGHNPDAFSEFLDIDHIGDTGIGPGYDFNF
jgi:hypothetical protein